MCLIHAHTYTYTCVYVLRDIFLCLCTKQEVKQRRETMQRNGQRLLRSGHVVLPAATTLCRRLQQQSLLDRAKVVPFAQRAVKNSVGNTQTNRNTCDLHAQKRDDNRRRRFVWWSHFFSISFCKGNECGNETLAVINTIQTHKGTGDHIYIYMH